MAKLTVIIPVADYHEAIAEQAVASCSSQTVPVEVIVIRDSDRKGTGWARNRGLEQVRTPFVTFLDADDTLVETFAEKTLSAWRSDRYIYTDWYKDGEVQLAPACAWVNRTWHVVTALVPTAWAKAVGGFDEQLPGAEDTDFFLKLCTSGRCGRRLPEALMHYRKGGQRGKAFVEGPAYQPTLDLFTRRYGAKTMGCCGENVDVYQPPVGEQFEGAMLAVALWSGNRQQRGAITGNLYPRTGNGHTAWVDARDVLASPNLWRAVEEPDTSLADIAAFLVGGSIYTPPVMPSPLGPTGEPAPNVDALLGLYNG
jgi:hypothetical protein